MKTVAIICEYNPFHLGHLYQINKIRELLGDDTEIIAVMSGNYTQRGEIAIADKTIRAQAAVECGINLVLELPFPFCASSAELFARAGVHIAGSLGVVDHLAFGSEDLTTEELTESADIMLSDKFQDELSSLSNDRLNSDKGYPKLLELAYKKAGGKRHDSLFSPNNILALEYIKAIKKEGVDMIPLAIKRMGAGYNDSLKKGTDLQSASAIRDILTNDINSALNYIPEKAKNTFLKAINNGKMPSDYSCLDKAFIAHFRLSSVSDPDMILDAGGGLYNRLKAISMKTNTINSLINFAQTKKFTTARIRRTILNSYFGVTSSEARALPSYVQVLALDLSGRNILKRMKKTASLPIITKPSDYEGLGERVAKQKSLSNKADSVYALTLKNPNEGTYSLTFSPFVKKG